MESCVTKKRLTRRAPDVWDATRFSSSFLRLFIFPVGRLRRPPPQRRALRSHSLRLGTMAQTVGRMIPNKIPKIKRKH